MVDPASIRNASFSLTPTGYNPEASMVLGSVTSLWPTTYPPPIQATSATPRSR